MNYSYFLLFLFLLPGLGFTQESGLVNGKEVNIAYQKFGNGYPVLIINGGPGMNSNGFASLAKLLCENNTTIIYDQRGTGKSKMADLKSSNLTMDLMIEDIEKLRKHLGYDQWIVLGHSFGGMLAYAYAAEHPDRVKAMIQSHSGGMSLNNVDRFSVSRRLSSTELDSLTYYTAMAQSTPGNPDLARKRAAVLAKAYLYGAAYEKTITDRLLQVNREINGLIWSNLRYNQFDKTGEMKNFKRNVLILHGDEDPVPVDIAENAHAILPNSKLVLMEQCGHYGWLDRPEIYLTEVKKFLQLNSDEVN